MVGVQARVVQDTKTVIKPAFVPDEILNEKISSWYRLSLETRALDLYPCSVAYRLCSEASLLAVTQG